MISLGGCGLGAVRLSADGSLHRPGDRVAVQLHNGSARSVGYGLCGLGLERQTPQGWQRVRPAKPITCSLLLRSLRPLGRSRAVRRLSPKLPAGRYRFSTRVEYPLGGKWHTLHSPPFHVGAR